MEFEFAVVKMVPDATNSILLMLSWFLNFACGENRVAIGLSTVKFECKTTDAPIWLENSKSKSISMAYGTTKRKTFTNDR